MYTEVSDSEFQMWRAVFAFALVDSFLSLEERKLMASYKAMVPFSKEQLSRLGRDFETRQDVEKLYKGITEADDKKRFCVLARAVVWCDGDMDRQETEILKRVSCLKCSDCKDILHSSRGHAHVGDYYQQYSKAGVIGLLDTPHILEMRL